MEKLRVLSLFAGIGGFDLGLERTGGFETVAFCEIEPFCQKVLAKHWPGVPIYDDVRTLTAERLAADGIAVDVICGGFPCQPFSHAAHGHNTAPDLWPEMARLISELRPRYAIAENVTFPPIGRASRFMRDELGVQCIEVCISADEIGADHQRNRWWAIAHPHSNGKLRSAIHAKASELRRLRESIWGAEAYRAAIIVSDGFSGGLAQLRCPGNAVMPQIPELIGRAILDAMEKPNEPL